jgi:hypothetical protein
MDEYAILTLVDPLEGEFVLFDSGDKKQMEELFTKLVTDSKEEENFYLVKLIKSAEFVLDVKDHGDTE